jgi:DNA-binding MarR family transcriptional regulator
VLVFCINVEFIIELSIVVNFGSIGIIEINTLKTLKKDFIDEVLTGWQKVDAVADIDHSGTEIVGRIVRASSLVGRKVDANLANYQLMVGDFDVLAALIRADNGQLTPGKIQELVMISSGGLSNRINRLEERSLIRRLPDPNDRRGVIVELTEVGQNLVLEVAPTHLSLENEMIQELNDEEKEILATLLKKLLLKMP